MPCAERAEIDLVGLARRVILAGPVEQTKAQLERISAIGGSFSLLPPWYDVDTLDDWRLLGAHVRALRQAGYDPQISHTEELLAAGVCGKGIPE